MAPRYASVVYKYVSYFKSADDIDCVFDSIYFGVGCYINLECPGAVECLYVTRVTSESALVVALLGCTLPGHAFDA